MLLSINGHDSVTNYQQLTGNDPNNDLVNINAYIKFGETLKILSGNEILTSIKDHNTASDVRNMMRDNSNKDRVSINVYQSPLILTEMFQHNLINVSYLTACYLYQVMMTLHFLNDVANDAESIQKSKITS